jgi:hypothetical protein
MFTAVHALRARQRVAVAYESLNETANTPTRFRVSNPALQAAKHAVKLVVDAGTDALAADDAWQVVNEAGHPCLAQVVVLPLLLPEDLRALGLPDRREQAAGPWSRLGRNVDAITLACAALSETSPTVEVSMSMDDAPPWWRLRFVVYLTAKPPPKRSLYSGLAGQ